MTQDRSAAKRASGAALVALGVALLGYGAHYLISNGNCSSTGYTQYGPVPKCGGTQGRYVSSVLSSARHLPWPTR